MNIEEKRRRHAEEVRNWNRERDKIYYLKTKVNGKRAEYRKKMKFITSVRDWTLYHFKGIKKECENCHSTEQLQFHHFVYRIPVEREDFMILCRPCHELLNRKKPGEPIGDGTW